MRCVSRWRSSERSFWRRRAIRRRAMRRSDSSCDSPGPLVPMPPPRRSRCCHMPRMRGRLYSSCASSTWSLPSAVRACWAKMSRISCVRSTTRSLSASSRRRCWLGPRSSSTTRDSARVSATEAFSSSKRPLPRYVRGSGAAPTLHDLADGLDAGRAHQLAYLPELLVGVDLGSQRRDQEGTLRLGAGRGIRLVLAHVPALCPVERPVTSCGSRARHATRWRRDPRPIDSSP